MPRELFKGHNRIIYRIVSDERIDVVAIIHASRRMPQGLCAIDSFRIKDVRNRVILYASFFIHNHD